MTCYENLPVEDAGRSPPAPMASHIAKWWRSKFRGGYKKFLVSESERTDTEELLGRAPSQCSAPPDLLPSDVRARLQPEVRATSPRPAQPSPPSPPNLRYEELTCDVRVRGDTAAEGQPLQFSFTLYDFDGHGRITKDDIAGIVSTIYESVGKRVKVPHYGSKTIQVRLSVSPEQRTEPEDRTTTAPNDRTTPGDRTATASNERTTPEAACPTTPAPVSVPAPVPIAPYTTTFPHCERCAARARRSSSGRRDGRRKLRRRRSRCAAAAVSAACAGADLSDRAADVSEEEDEVQSRRSRRSRLSIDDDDVSDWSGAAAAPRRHFAPPPTDRDERRQRHRRTHHKKRSGSLQRQELLQIIQANMEKNHLTFQNSRKADENPAANEDSNSNNVKRHRHRNRSYTVSDKPPADLHHKRRSKRQDNGYLDLASGGTVGSVEEAGGRAGTGAGGGNLCRYDRHLHAVICSSARHASAGLHAGPAHTNTHAAHKLRTPNTRPPYKPLEPRVLQIIFL